MPKARFLVPLLPFSLLVASFGLGGSTALTACSGSSGGVNDCFDYTGFQGKTPAAHFKADVLPIFRRSCGLSMSCHGAETNSVPAQHYYGSALSAGDMTDTQIQEVFDQAVGVASVTEPTMQIIKPGDPAHSLMMYKLDGDPSVPLGVNCEKLKCAADVDAGCGESMPVGGPQLPDADRDTVRRWIAQGAQND